MRLCRDDCFSSFTRWPMDRAELRLPRLSLSMLRCLLPSLHAAHPVVRDVACATCADHDAAADSSSSSSHLNKCHTHCWQVNIGLVHERQSDPQRA